MGACYSAFSVCCKTPEVNYEGSVVRDQRRFQGTGHRLGGAESGQSAAERQLEAAERRQREWDARAGIKTKKTTKASTSVNNNNNNNNNITAVNDNNDVELNINVNSENAAAVAAATAAEQRIKNSNKGMTDERAEELREKREKDALLGKIQAYYDRTGTTEPFGLRAASVTALKKELNRLQNQQKYKQQVSLH